MLEYAESVFEDLASTADGATLGAHRRQLEKQKANSAPDAEYFEVPDLDSNEQFPHELHGVWQLYQELSKGRQAHVLYIPAGMGAFKPKLIHMNLPNTEIEAWCRLMDFELEPWEIYVIRQLDSLFVKAANK